MNKNVVKSLEFVEMEEKSQILFLITETHSQINIINTYICGFRQQRSTKASFLACWEVGKGEQRVDGRGGPNQYENSEKCDKCSHVTVAFK